MGKGGGGRFVPADGEGSRERSGLALSAIESAAAPEIVPRLGGIYRAIHNQTKYNISSHRAGRHLNTKNVITVIPYTQRT